MVVRHATHAAVRLGVEVLEDRRLLSLVPQLVSDIAPVGNDSSLPEIWGEFNGTLFFTADDGISGQELWKSDGTTAGTVLFKDIQPGIDSSRPLVVRILNGGMFFTADDGIHGRELWVSDGTSEGTVMVTDLFPGEDSLWPKPHAIIGGNLLFTARDDTGARRLWRTDGTAEGTILIEDFQSEDGPNYPEDFKQFGEDLFFSALNPPSNYRLLWKSDGTVEGTVLVRDIENDGLYPSSPHGFVDVGGTLYFEANHLDDFGRNVNEIWKTDGTFEGTERIVSFSTHSERYPAPDPRSLRDVNGELFYVIGELYKGLHVVKDICPGTCGSYPKSIAEVGDSLFFTANDGTHGRELWVSDGTSAGTVLVKDIWPGSRRTAFFSLINGSSLLYFGIIAPELGHELWRSDGTSDGTYLLKDIQPGGDSSAPRPLAVKNDVLIFTAIDETSGRELWMTDGSTEGTLLLGDIRPGIESSEPRGVRILNGGVYFTADDGIHGRELWKLVEVHDLPGDTNGDGRVSLDDLNNVRNHFGETGPGVIGDTNGDGVVNVDDVNAVRNNFGVTANGLSVAAQPLKQTENAAPPAGRNTDALVRRVDQPAVDEIARSRLSKHRHGVEPQTLRSTDRVVWRNAVDDVIQDDQLWWRVPAE